MLHNISKISWRQSSIQTVVHHSTFDKCLYLCHGIKIRCQGRAWVKKRIVKIWRKTNILLIKTDICALKCFSLKNTDRKLISGMGRHAGIWINVRKVSKTVCSDSIPCQAFPLFLCLLLWNILKSFHSTSDTQQHLGFMEKMQENNPTKHITARCPRGQAASVWGRHGWVDSLDNR